MIHIEDQTIPVTKQFSAECDVNLEHSYIASMGPTNFSTYKLKAGTANNSQISFNYNVPSVRTGILRRAFIEVHLSARAIVGHAGDHVDVPTDAVLNAGFMDSAGVRQFPIMSCSNTMSLDLNNTRFSWLPRHCIHAITSYDTNKETDDRYYLGMADPVASFSVGELVTGAARNPNGYYNSNSSQQSRNISQYQYTKTAGANNGLFSLVLYEPVMISPFSMDLDKDRPALHGISSLNLTYMLGQPLNRLFTLTYGATTDVSAQNVDSIAISDAYLHLDMITFNNMYPMPSIPMWNTKELISHKGPTFELGNMVSNAEHTFYSNSLSLSQIPSHIFAYIKRSSTDDSCLTPDAFFRIKQVRVSFANKTALLSSLDEFDLFKICVQNGYRGSYMEARQKGLPLCIDVAKQLSLDDLSAVGLRGQFDLSIEMIAVRPVAYPTVRTACAAAAGVEAGPAITNSFHMEIVCAYNNIVYLARNGSLVQTGPNLTEDHILEAPIDFGGEIERIDVMMSGSGFMDKMKGFARKGAKVLQKGLEMTEKLAPHATNLLAASSGLAQELGHDKMGAALAQLGEHSTKAGQTAGKVRAQLGGSKPLTRSQILAKLR